MTLVRQLIAESNRVTRELWYQSRSVLVVNIPSERNTINDVF